MSSTGSPPPESSFVAEEPTPSVDPTTAVPPTISNNQTSSPPPPEISAPPPGPGTQSSPPPETKSPPPSTSGAASSSPPPESPSTSSPPPDAPPPEIPSAPPPDTVSSPPPVASSPPQETVAPSPPAVAAPRSNNSPPPKASPTQPAEAPPSPIDNVSPPPPSETASPPPPSKDATPPPPGKEVSPPRSSPPSSPPPPKSKSPKHSPPPPPPPSDASTKKPRSPPPPRNSTSSPALAFSPPPPTKSSRSVKPSTPLGTEKPAAEPPPSRNNTFSSVEVALISVAVSFSLLILFVIAVWITRRRRRRPSVPEYGYPPSSPYASSQNSDSMFLRVKSSALSGSSHPGLLHAYSSSDSGGYNQSKSWFTYDELIQATNGFSKDNLLGEGGFGCVYKGFLVDGREVAVKQLKIGGNQGEREFRAEVEIIGRIHHRHLVSLVGYCISEYQRLLVYDYLPNNTLHYHLHGEAHRTLDWATRVKIAAGAARGLAYLHEDCHPRIIHRDIKSSNILLDSNFEARVSDFGLAKLAQELDSNTHVSTRVMGTFGYLAPEYATSGKLTEKSDVYSFGVVLLEIITGRRPVDSSQPLGEESLVEWARPLLGEALDREAFEPLTDPKLGKNYVVTEMFRMIEAAAACVRHSATRRPRMSQVARVLDSLNESSDLSNGMKPGDSEIFNSRDQSAQMRIFQRMAFGSQDFSSNFFNQSQSSWKSRDHGEQGSHV